MSAVRFGVYLLQGAAPGLGGAERRSIRRIPQMYRRTQHSEVKSLILSDTLNFSTPAGNARPGCGPVLRKVGRDGVALFSWIDADGSPGWLGRGGYLLAPGWKARRWASSKR